MGRPRKDKFEEVSYGFRKGTEHKLVHVSVPFWFNVTLLDKHSHGTTNQLVSTIVFTKDEIRKLFQEKDFEAFKFEEATIRLPDFCERCGRTGVPIIQKKSNYDNRLRTRTDSPSRTNRPDEYWLNYQHTEKPKICRIAIFDEKRFLFKKAKDRIDELDKHFFPLYLEKMKKELDISDFFQKFANTSHT